MTTDSESFFDKINNQFKGVFTYFSNKNKAVEKAQDDFNISIDKTKDAEQALIKLKAAEAEAAKVLVDAKAAAAAEAAKGTTTTTGGKSKRKGTRKPNGKKNKKTRRN